MKNENDYNSGWTTPTINPATGKKCAGGAARNLRIAQSGGANAVQVLAALTAVDSIQPIIQQQQEQIQQQGVQIKTLSEAVGQAIKALETHGKK